MSKTGCNEYQSLSRRQLLSSLKGLAPAWVPDVKYTEESQGNFDNGPIANTLGKRDILVTVYLRGGMDGLTTCVPWGDANYYSLRSTIAVHRPDDVDATRRAINLDGYFGMAPAMAPAADLFNAGVLAFVHGTGSTDQTRSHFDAQHFMEAGNADSLLFTGWVGRHLASVAPTVANADLRALALAGTLPLIMEGAPKTLAIPSLNDIQYGGRNETVDRRVAWLQTAYKEADAVLQSAANTTIKTVAMLQSVNFGSYVPGGGATFVDQHGSDPFGFLTSMKASAALIKKQVGIEAINIDYGGWDTHANADPFGEYGALHMLMDNLSRGLRDFYLDVDSAGLMGTVTVMVMSEFGRAAFENGSQGCDHGHGNCMLFMGKNVNGGKVYRKPAFSLDPAALSLGRDLEVTIDYRLLVAELLTKRLLNTNLASVLPTYTPGAYLGLFK